MSTCELSDKEVVEKLNEHLDKVALVRDFRTGVKTKDEVLKVIAESGPEIAEPLEDGYILLHPFGILGEYDIIEKLWEKGVRPVSFHENRCSILHCAVRTYPPVEAERPRDEDRAKMLRLYLSHKDTYGEFMPIGHKSHHGWTALRMATKLHLENCVEVLLEHGANPNIPESEGYSLLHYAVGRPAIIKMLLNVCSNNINCQDLEGRTALLFAIEKGSVESALTLLERGADPNIRNKAGIAPLFLAAKMGQMDVVRALVRSGSDVNAPGGGQGITALHWAAFKEMEGLVIFLIENGANVAAKDTKGRTPLSMVSEKLQIKMKEVVTRCSPGLCPNDLASSPAMSAERKAMEACCHGNISALCNLIKSGVDVNFRCKQTESSLLHRAAYYGQASAVVFLAHHGADMKAVDKDNDNVLHFANMKDFPHGCHLETLRFLLCCQQVDINSQNRLGDTPLMLAVRNCLSRQVRMLLKYKASVDITNHRGETPLHAACHCPQSLEILFHIVEHSKDLNVCDSANLTPLMHAVKHNCVPGAKYLLQKGARTDLRDSHGQTALLMATEKLNWDLAEVLLMGGADPNMSGMEKKFTPLHIAAQKMNKMMTKVLLEHGADIDIADADGNTPLDYLPSPHLREAIKMAVQARHEIKSELRAPRDKNAACFLATPSSQPFGACMAKSACSDFIPCNEAKPSCDRDEDSCSVESSRSVGEDSGYCISSTDIHWGRTLTTQSSTVSNPEEEEEEDDKEEVEEEEDAFEEGEGEIDETEDGEISQERFQKLQSEFSKMKRAYQESREALKSATKHNEELNSQIKSLVEEMRRTETQTVSRHLHHAVALSMHAICHNVLLDGQQQENPQALANKSQEMTLIDAYKKVGLEEKGNQGMLTAEVRNHPWCMDDTARGNANDALSDHSNDAECSSQSLSDKRTDSLESSCSENSQDGNFRYRGACGGMSVHHRPLSMIQPINHTRLQWWMVSKSDYKVSDESLNNSDLDTNFFDVSHGTFHHMDVAVRTVKGVTKWKIEVYFSFFKEVNYLSCLHCPWIVQFLGACFDSVSGTCSIINEYMHHGSLHSILHEKNMELDWDTRQNIVWDVSRGMLFLHSHKLLHRKLNPSNILIGEHFNAKLNDFGLYETKVKSGYYDNPDCTHQAYMAPEALGNNDFTVATDMYSFGIVMFETSTSKRAFADLLKNPIALGVQLMMGARPNFPSSVPSDYKDLAAQCWQKEPGDRPSFEVIADSIKHMQSHDL